MGYCLEGRSSIPGRCKIFTFYITSRLAIGILQPLIQCVPGALNPVKRQGREDDHSPPSSVDVKSGDRSVFSLSFTYNF
jgi:hypothetical protein